MKTDDFLPAERLRPFVKTYKIIGSADGMVNRVVPNTSFTMAFRLSGHVSYVHKNAKAALPAATLSGLRKSARLIEYGRDSSTLIVIFTQLGLAPFFRQPLHELFDQSIPLDCVIPCQEVSRIEQRLAEVPDNKSKIALVEEFLLSRLYPAGTDKLVAEAISKMNVVKGNIKMKELANQLYISQDAFEKRFRKTTGATPKQFAHITKMNNVIRQSAANPSLMDMAFENGYYDQPHFNKDFKIFTGQTPTEFFKAPLYW